MCIRRSNAPLAAVVLIACWANAVLGQSSVTIPPSSIANPADAGSTFHTNVQVRAFPTGRPQPDGGPPMSGYFYEDPASLACIYGLTRQRPQDGGCNPNNSSLNNPNGGSKAIAVVDAYDYPTAVADLAAFSAQFDVPAPTSFSVVYAPSGSGLCTTAVSTPPAQDPTGGWEVEEALDIQYAHSMAPHATLYLVEARSNSDVDLFCAVTIASNLVAEAGGGEVSMSWGSNEFPAERTADSIFTTPNRTFAVEDI